MDFQERTCAKSFNNLLAVGLPADNTSGNICSTFSQERNTLP
jgi:hypothetical protein